MSELMQFEIGISTSLYLPAIGTAGFDRDAVSGYNRDPRITSYNVCYTKLLREPANI